MKIGYKLFKADKTDEKYRNMALWCKDNNATIEDKGQYYEIVATKPYVPTIKEQVEEMETKTGLTRVVREIALAENSGASEYTKIKAQEIEELAKQLRG